VVADKGGGLAFGQTRWPKTYMLKAVSIGRGVGGQPVAYGGSLVLPRCPKLTTVVGGSRPSCFASIGDLSRPNINVYICKTVSFDLKLAPVPTACRRFVDTTTSPAELEDLRFSLLKGPGRR